MDSNGNMGFGFRWRNNLQAYDLLTFLRAEPVLKEK
jgi:hypothetical protein